MFGKKIFKNSFLSNRTIFSKFSQSFSIANFALNGILVINYIGKQNMCYHWQVYLNKSARKFAGPAISANALLIQETPSSFC